MPYITINNCKYYYEVTGKGSDTIVLSHGLLWSGKMFQKQVKYFSQRYKVITYDHRGQGRSEVTKEGYTMEQLYADAVDLLVQLDSGPVHFGGLSMGGFIAMRLAARRPDLIKSLILMETTAQDEPNKIKYNLLNNIVRTFGVKIVTKPVMKIMFGQNFLNDISRKEERKYWTHELQNNKKTIVNAVQGVIDRKGVEGELQNIKCPTLILVGTQDVATTPDKAEFIHQHIKGSELYYIEGGGHSSSIEEPEQYNRVIDKFLSNIKDS